MNDELFALRLKQDHESRTQSLEKMMSDTFTWQMCLEQGGHRYTEAGICMDCMAMAGNCPLHRCCHKDCPGCPDCELLKNGVCECR